MEGSLNAVYVTLWKTDSGILSFSYSRTTEQNKFGFVQFDRPKIENHLLTPEPFHAKTRASKTVCYVLDARVSGNILIYVHFMQMDSLSDMAGMQADCS